MKVAVIVPSIRSLEEWSRSYLNNFEKYGYSPDIVVIDEDNHKIRAKNKKSVPQAEFYGIKEREKWFKGRKLVKFSRLIPERSHAETSFGLLVAYERNYDMVVFSDDDTLASKEDFLGTHWNNLTNMPTLYMTNKWINVTGSLYYPRGYPYSQRRNPELSSEFRKPKEVVLNQGLWTFVPDMNAVDILASGGTDGIVHISLQVPASHTVPIGSYVTVCSMNLAFRREVIPAFYQLPEGEYGIGRFDDIWSGLFLKKILDHLGKGMSYGKPVCTHNKQPRNIFKDIRAELEGMVINEKLWKIVDKIELSGNQYIDCYGELAEQLSKEASEFHIPYYIKYMCKRMVQWTELIDKVV